MLSGGYCVYTRLSGAEGSHIQLSFGIGLCMACIPQYVIRFLEHRLVVLEYSRQRSVWSNDDITLLIQDWSGLQIRAHAAAYTQPELSPGQPVV